MDKKYFDQIMIEESKAILERVKDYTPEQKELYFKGYFDSLQRFVDLGGDLFLQLIQNAELKH